MKTIPANESQQTRDKGTKRYFLSYPAGVHSATYVSQVSLLQSLVSTQVKNVKGMCERKK